MVIKQVRDLIQKIFHSSYNLIDLFYLPSMLKKVHDIAIEDALEKRTVDVNEFVEDMKEKAKNINKIILWNYEDSQKTIHTLISYLNDAYSFKTGKYNYVLQFGKTWSDNDIMSLIKTLVPRFVSAGKRIDNCPLTFGLEADHSKMIEFKTDLMNRVNQEASNLAMNDGYETFGFLPELFSKGPLFSTSKSGVNYTKEISFNYRLSSLSNCNIALSKFKNPFVFCFDTQFSVDADIPNLQLENFSVDSVQMLLGGLLK